MKDHVRETRTINNPYGDKLEDHINHLRELAEGLVDPVVDNDYQFGYGGDDDRIWVINGWRPMTDKEIADRDNAEKAKRAAARAAKKAKEIKEREEYERLKKKFEK